MRENCRELNKEQDRGRVLEQKLRDEEHKRERERERERERKARKISGKRVSQRKKERPGR